jgi:GNAT superfamily N-acetyltransferase/DNA-binding MarR family transcriptional regulator
MPDPALAADVAAFRRFNRAYTRFLGTLSEGYLRTEFSLAEGRVLYEIATQPRPQAKSVAAALDLDAGYLSRILAKFRHAGLVACRTSKADNRAADLLLTARGRAALRTLNQRADRQARAFFTRLPGAQRTQFIGSLEAIEASVQGSGLPPAPITLRTHRPGDMGAITALEGAGYVAQFGWDTSFEALVARIVADFLDHFDAARERCWIAEMDGRPVGHIFCVRHPDQPGTAKLRLLFVDPAARGRGLGQTLVAECIRFARQAGYARITLWTQSILTAAHRIYQAAGFRLVREEPHHSFGKDLIGQTWELDLREIPRTNRPGIAQRRRAKL